MMKQRNGVLIVRDRGWFQNPAYGRVSYRLLEDLRRQLSKADLTAADVFGAVAPAAGMGEAESELLARYVPVAALTPRIQPALFAYGLEGERGRRPLLSPGGVRLEDLSLRTRQRLTAVENGEWKGAGLAREPDARIRLEMTLGPDQVKLGYIISAGGAREQSLPMLRANKPGAPLFVAAEETDPL
jgi:hypothetical protein